MSVNSKLPIYEQFFTWQGEGIHQGRSAYFIRTFGCPVHCPGVIVQALGILISYQILLRKYTQKIW